MKMEKRCLRWVGLVVLGIIAAGSFGCAPMQTAGVTAAGPAVDMLLNNLLDTGNARVLKEGLPSQVLLLTGIAEMSPHDRNMLTTCSLAYTSWGMMVEDEDPEFAQELFGIGKSYGMRALETNKKFRQGLEAGKKIPELVMDLDERYVKTLTWCALSTGLEIIHQMDDPMALMGLPDAVAMISRSVELDPQYFYGVGKSFLAAYYALIPAFLGLGGGPDASAAMFAEAREITDGKFLMVDVFEARYLATYIDDQELFEDLMNKVLAADSSALPGGEALNDLAKRKAKYFLSIQEDLF